MDKKNELDVTFVFFISLLIVAQHVSGNHVPIIRSWRLNDVIALCWYVPWLQEGGQVRLVGSASMDGFVSQLALRASCETNPQKVTSSWFFLSTLNYDARSTTHQIRYFVAVSKEHQDNEAGIVQNVENFFITLATMFLGMSFLVVQIDCHALPPRNSNYYN